MTISLSKTVKRTPLDKKDIRIAWYQLVPKQMIVESSVFPYSIICQSSIKTFHIKFKRSIENNACS